MSPTDQDKEMQANEAQSPVSQEHVQEVASSMESQPVDPVEAIPHLEQALKAEIDEYKDKYLRLYADFENLRKRSLKERLDLIKTAGEELMTALLPVLDDMERAVKALEAQEAHPAKEGVLLIAHKLQKTLEGKGLKTMNALGESFNSELHEAITEIAVTDEKQQGKVVDEVEKGYYLHDKVIRYAKVVVGK
jgi:molecular chaperone GrpE